MKRQMKINEAQFKKIVAESINKVLMEGYPDNEEGNAEDNNTRTQVIGQKIRAKCLKSAEHHQYRNSPHRVQLSAHLHDHIRHEQDHSDLGHLRGLKLNPAQIEPAPRAIYRDAERRKPDHRHQDHRP